MPTELRHALDSALKKFETRPLDEAALAFWKVLGYESERRIPDLPTDARGFAREFQIDDTLRRDRAHCDKWQSIHFVFQVTSEEISGQNTLFGRGADVDTLKEEDKAYMFFALELAPGHYNRSTLAQIARELNRPFASPVLLLVKNGSALTLAVVDRRPNKKDATREVLEKVTLIQNIKLADPHPAHLRILEELELSKLPATTWAELHAEWRRVLDLSELNKKFFKELSDWYFWARGVAQFPSAQTEAASSVAVIRLITRTIFVYFIKERGLVPNEFFEPQAIPALLKETSPGKGTYYNAILQNLFFASLNAEDGARGWQDEVREFHGKSESYGDATKRRYREMFNDDKRAEKLFNLVPFLNGGLFECQDDKTVKPECLYDGFSSKEQKRAVVPNKLFFGSEQNVDLNEAYNTTNKSYHVRPLLEILNRYKFTVAENTPLEEEVALDPELLGKVFENLLASYNPETASTARKQTGSFYTPREIVDYMVEESLVAYLETALPEVETNRLHALATYDLTDDGDFSLAERKALISAVGRVTILDPACGSGAFPMGVLHRLTHILKQLDPGSELWRAEQQKQINALDIAEVREAAQRRFEEAIERDGGDYVRKLYLIERCLFGVDIQPIAVQIAKLRFFISLVVEQKLDAEKPSRGVQPLPNLETKIVAANTLLRANAGQSALTSEDAQKLEDELSEVRRRHFSARKWSEKKTLRARDKELREALAAELRDVGMPKDAAQQMADWNPYDQNQFAPFFEPEWMFGVKDGFDIAIANPPFVDIKKLPPDTVRMLFRDFKTAQNRVNLYAVFIEKGLNLLKPTGVLAYINPNSLLVGESYSELRKLLLPRLSKIIKLPDDTFESATVETMLTFTRGDSEFPTVLAKTYGHHERVEFSTIHFEAFLKTEWAKEPHCRFGIFGNSGSSKICTKMKENKVFLDFVEFSLGITPYDKYRGHSEAIIKNRLYHSPTKKGKEYVPLIDGGSIQRYYIADKVIEYLKYGDWLGAPREERFFTSPRIIVRQIASGNPPQIYAGFTEEPLYHTQIGFALLSRKNSKAELLFLLALLNSKALNFYHRETFLDKEKVTFQKVLIANCKQLPVPTATPSDQKAIEALVRRILTAKQKNPHADMSALEAEINTHVYRLYGLSKDDIRIIEGTAGNTAT